MFTCIQTRLHRIETGCKQVCHLCLQKCLQEGQFSLQSVYRFTVLFLFD